MTKHAFSAPDRAAARGGRLPAVLDLWDEGSGPRLPAGLIDVRRIPMFLRRNLLRILAVAAAVALAGVGACLLLLNSYAATALVIIDPRDAKVTQTPDVLSNIGPDAIAIESLVQVANSDGFLGRVVDRLGLMTDPDFAASSATDGATDGERRSATIDRLRSRVKIARRGTTYVIDVTATGRDAERCASLANTVAGLVVDDQAHLRSGSTADATDFLDEKLDALRDRLHTAEAAAAALKAKLNLTDAGTGGTLQERRVAELNQQLVQATSRAAEARARSDQIRAAGAAAPDALPAALQTAVLSTLRQDYARLTRQTADQRSVYGDRYPEVQSLKAQVADVKRQIAAEVGRMIASTRSDAQETAARVATLTDELRRAQADSGRQGNDRVRLDEIEREARADRAVYEQLLDRQKQLSELRGLTPTDIRVASPALPPARPSRPKLAVLAGAFSALGLLAGLAVSLVAEGLRGTVMTRAQAERLLGLGVSGVVPKVGARPGHRRPGAPALPPDVGPWMEDLRRAAAADAPGQCRVVLVTSARAGEGKTTLARNLARALAQGGDHVLLVEAAPSEAAGAPARFGLLDVIIQGCGPERAFLDVPHMGFTRMPFGRFEGADAGSLDGMLGTARLATAIRSCRNRFDSIVIDGPAVFEAGYAATLAGAADLSLMVVEWDATESAEVAEALERLRPADAAVVLNKVDVARYARYETEGVDRLRRGRTVRAVAEAA